MEYYRSSLMNVDPDTVEQPDTDLLVDDDTDKRIILFNDDVNTFDFVIECLIEICEHDPHQAEQCAYLVHYKGKCDVKRGSFEDLKPRCEELVRRGLTAEIQ